MKPVPEPEVKSAIECRLEQERNHQWNNYGPAWHSLMNNMKKEKDQRRHELLLLDRRKGKLEEWRKRLDQREQELRVRENRVFEVEPLIPVAHQLQNLRMGIEEVLPWIETIHERVEAEKIDHKTAAAQIAQELRLYRQSGGIQKQIERANQELGLINMATIQKPQALTVLIDLLERGVTESQIVQLIDFAGEWQKYQNTTTTDGKNNLQQPSNGNNGYGDGNLSMNDLIRLNLLKSTTERATNMLNRMGTTH
ncbi:MAG: hypothetical protein WBZ36_08250 [Candidatus Nitrosopolaris sp.]